MDPYSISCGASLANSTISQDEQSKSLSLKMGVVSLQPSSNFKQMMTSSQFQDQESSSTQSTGQSYSHPEVHPIDETNRFGQAIVFAQTECNVNDRKATDGPADSAVSMISQDSLFSPPQLDYNKSLVCLPLQNAEPYFSGFMASYGPHQAMISHPNMIGMVNPRVPLPFDPMRSEPLYVNPKQYHAILRRREHRAKLEAQSKLSKDRKPYLHESRHLHALRRVRGSGGRFLSAKKLQEEESSKPNSNIEGSNCRNSHSSSIHGDMGSTASRSDITTENMNMISNPSSRFVDYVSGGSSAVTGHKWFL